MKEITFITSHPKKAAELATHLDHPITHRKLDLAEIQSLDPIEVASAKVLEAYRVVGSPVLVEDFSLQFEALGRLPGPLIKWFIQELDIDGLCHLLDSYSSRKATAQTCFALCESGSVKIFNGIMTGTIAPEPRGLNGFGTDAIFIPDGYTETWGQMNEQGQIDSSLRRIGLKKLESYLHKS